MNKRVVLILCILLIGISTFSQPTIILIDKNVKVGKLPNGLTYYIRKNTKPEQRVELRLIVNAGSVLEKDNQQGVAHFLEHMAFNGTKKFPKNALLNYLQKTGVRFGADLNATTSFDFTMYMLPISTTDATVLQNGYQVLREWAGDLLLDAAEIDKERGIILEEKRMRQNAYMRTIANYFPDMLNNSTYSKRLPIGKEEIIKTAPRKAFVDFYKDWYRPNNMAIIAVGDIDVAKTEATIRNLFGDLKNPPNAPQRPDVIPIKWHTANKAKIVNDAENINNMLTITMNMEKAPAGSTWDALATEKLYEVISSLFDGRLEEYMVNPKSPIGGGGISLKSGFFRGYKSASISAFVKENPVDAMNLMIAELLRAKQFGFTKPELDRVKKNILTLYEKLFAEKDKTESASHVNEYMQHFLEKEVIPGIEAEKNFVEAFLNKLTIEKINKTISTFNINTPAFILFNATEAKKNIVTEAQLLAAWEKAKQQKVDAYVEKKISYELMEQMPTAGKIIAIENNTDFNSKILALSNGIKVIYKKTDFKNDEIVFKGTQWGGLANLTVEEIQSAKSFPLISSLGLGNHKGSDMPKILSGVQVSANMFPSLIQLSLVGNSTVKDFEKFLQILHLKLTKVNFDAEEFEGIKEAFSSQLGGLSKNPLFKFNDTLNKYRFNYSNRLSGLPSAEELKLLKLSDLAAVYTKLTNNFNGATFVFTGNLDEANFSALMEKYIASIPTKSVVETLNKANLVKPIIGQNTFTFKAGKENKSQINYSYYADVSDVLDKDILAFTLMGDILQIKTTEKLREEMGGTYSPAVNTIFTRPPVGAYNLNLSVSSLPENVDKLIAAYDDLIKTLINGIVTDDDMIKARAQRNKVFETQSKTNMYWSNLLEQQYNYSFDPKNITEYIKKVEAITKEDIIAVAKKYLSNANTLKGVMNPE